MEEDEAEFAMKLMLPESIERLPESWLNVFNSGVISDMHMNVTNSPLYR